MKKIIVEAEASLDGCMGGEDAGFWEHVFPYHTPDVEQYLNDLLFAPDALLMGRKTYQFFSNVWPTRDGKQADYINRMPKYVASRKLKEPLDWNASLLKENAVEEIKKIKMQPGKSLLQYGIGELTEAMLKAGLVDEFNILIFPFSYGKGVRIFENMDINNFILKNTRVFTSGAVALTYQVKK